ncbi:MAG TPA: helix-turn-helix transcriptional regulator [Conexibacter sp.]|nr:helix-turn-helix transcriptional regulator [Conexibacter sp.]
MPKRTKPGSPLGQAVRERRTEIGMTQEELAHAAGTSQKRVWQIESTSTRVSYDALCALAEALGVPLEMLTIRAGVIASDRAKHDDGASGRPKA